MSQFIEPTGNYGRVWGSVYSGSLIGSGAEVFTLWPYVIANMGKSAQFGATVMLNPKLLAAIFGEDEDFVLRGIAKLSAPDPASKNGVEDEGRRLVHLSGHCYRVVNGAGYMMVRSRESNAEAQRRYRDKKKKEKLAQAASALPDPGKVEEKNRAHREAKARAAVREAATEVGEEAPGLAPFEPPQ